MKYLSCLPIVVLLAFVAGPDSAFPQAVFEWQNPYPTGSTLNDVEVLSPGVAIAVGYNATVMITRDSAKSWTLVPFAAYEVFSSVEFLNDRVGLLGGQYGKLYRTEDGGESWSLTNIAGGGANSFFQDIHILDERNAVAVGGSILPEHVVLRSVDGGKNWVSGQTPDVTMMFRGVWFIDSLNGWIVGDRGNILRSTDGGYNWILHSSGQDAGWGNVRLHGIVFADRQRGVAVGEKGTVLLTTDGGENWTKQEIGVNADLYSVKCLDSMSLLAVGDNRVLRSEDGGTTWIEQNVGGRYYRVDSDPSSKWTVAVGYVGVSSMSSDSGKSWTGQYRSVMAGTVNGIYFRDREVGVMVGELGATAWTDNGGRLWTGVPSGTFDKLVKVDYPGAGLICALGDNGDVARSVDGGKSWGVKSKLSAKKLLGLDFVSERCGFIVGVGTILKTINGGDSWTADETSVPNALWSVAMLDSLNGFVGGYGGALYRTTNSGGSWEPISTGSSAQFDYIFVFDMQNVVVAHSRGTLRTTDGGDTWNEHGIPGGTRVYGVAFVDPLTGWATGENGVYYETTDGGVSWQTRRHNVAQSQRGNAAVRSLFFLDRSTGWFGGNDGTLLLYQDKSISDVRDVHIEENYYQSKNAGVLRLTPNPANDKLHIVVEREHTGPTTIELCDLLGRPFREWTLAPGEVSIHVPVSELSQGLWYVLLRDNSGNQSVRSIVIRH